MQLNNLALVFLLARPAVCAQSPAPSAPDVVIAGSSHDSSETFHSRIHPSPSLPVTCKDTHPECRQWADDGECKRNRGTMFEMCCKSCTLARCMDTSQYCADWAEKGECQRNRGVMEMKCCKTCKEERARQHAFHASAMAEKESHLHMGSNTFPTAQTVQTAGMADPCDDIDTHCTAWAADGECHRNKGAMARTCCRTCSVVREIEALKKKRGLEGYTVPVSSTDTARTEL